RGADTEAQRYGPELCFMVGNPFPALAEPFADDEGEGVSFCFLRHQGAQPLRQSSAGVGTAKPIGRKKAIRTARRGTAREKRLEMAPFRRPGDPRGTHGFASHPCGWFAFVEEPGWGWEPGDPP